MVSGRLELLAFVYTVWFSFNDHLQIQNDDYLLLTGVLTRQLNFTTVEQTGDQDPESMPGNAVDGNITTCAVTSDGDYPYFQGNFSDWMAVTSVILFNVGVG